MESNKETVELLIFFFPQFEVVSSDLRGLCNKGVMSFSTGWQTDRGVLGKFFKKIILNGKKPQNVGIMALYEWNRCEKLQ